MPKNNYPSEYDLPQGLSAPAVRALESAGLTRLDLIASRSEKELLKLHGMGQHAMRVLKEELKARGLSIASSG